MTGQADSIACDLDAALAAAGEAHIRFVKTLMEFGRRFPGDQRRFGALVATDPEREKFDVAQSQVAALRREADAAQAQWDLKRKGSPE